MCLVSKLQLCDSTCSYGHTKWKLQVFIGLSIAVPGKITSSPTYFWNFQTLELFNDIFHSVFCISILSFILYGLYSVLRYEVSAIINMYTNILSEEYFAFFFSKWCTHLRRSLCFVFQLLGECLCCWTRGSRSHMCQVLRSTFLDL